MGHLTLDHIMKNLHEHSIARFTRTPHYIWTFGTSSNVNKFSNFMIICSHLKGEKWQSDAIIINLAFTV